MACKAALDNADPKTDYTIKQVPHNNVPSRHPRVLIKVPADIA